MVPTPESLRRADVALDGVVSRVTGAGRRCEPPGSTRGGPAEAVEVARPGTTREALLLGVRSEEGGRYLLAADEGTVMVCGLSGPHEQRLAALYERAFAG